MNTIYNVATDSYVQNVACAEVRGVVSTDSIPITILNNQVSFLKTPDNLFVELGETIPYTLTLKNTSDVTLTQTQIIDVLPAGISFVPDTLKVNGNSMAGDIQTGITLTNKLLPGGQIVVNFSGIVTTIPPTTYYNTASTTYSYQLSATSGQRTNTIKSNTVLAKAIQGILYVTKTADRIEAQLQDQILYTITIVNEGSVEATNLIMTDIIPPQVTFIPNTFTLNGVVIPNVDLTAGVLLGNLAVGATDTVQFKVNVTDDSVPVVNNRGGINYSYVKDPNKPPINNNTNSNLAVVVVQKPEITITKSTPTTTVVAGQTVTYNLTLENTGTVGATNVVVTDTLPQGMSLVPNSTTVNGTSVTGNISSGLNVGTIAMAAKTTISFQAVVNTIPPNTFTNSAAASFSYIVNGLPDTGTSTSNAVVITGQGGGGGSCVNSLAATMVVNQTQVQKGDSITYKVIIKNTGTQMVSNLVLTDILDPALRLVPNSITLDGAPIQGNLSHLAIGNLPAGGSVTIGFTATVVSGCPGSVITNQASVQCTNGDCSADSIQTNPVNVTVIRGSQPPYPPCPCPDPYPPEPCPPTPCPPEPYPPCPSPDPYPPYPGEDCQIERVITPIYLPNYIHCINQITGISGFIKSVKPVSYGHYSKILVIYVIKLEYVNSSGLCYTYQQCEEVYLDKCKYNSNTVVDIESIEQPYAVDSRYVEVIMNLSICNN